MDDLKHELLDIKIDDDRRNAFLQKLITTVETLNSERDRDRSQFSRLEFTCDQYQRALESTKVELDSLKKNINRSPFVLVLIDGDITLFDDDYIRRGALGGRDAARNLYTHVEQYLKKLADHQDHWEIIIKVYSNLNGLGKTYAEARIAEAAVFREFVRSFNKEYAHCEYIDAGDDKEAADKKVQRTMDLFYHNSHCKHIILGLSGDNSYTGFLRPVMPTNGKSQRMTLIEALPFTAGLEEIAHGFQHARFEQLFRESKLMTRRVSFKEDRTITPPKTPVSSYAATVSRHSDGAVELPINEPQRPAATAPPDGRVSGRLGLPIHRNRRGQRVDPPVDYDQKLVKLLKARKYCNRHFLSTCGYACCTHSHEGKLSSSELETLRYIARLSPCTTIWCNDTACVAGHRCPYCAPGQACAKGGGCRFPAEMHNVDAKIVEVVQV